MDRALKNFQKFLKKKTTVIVGVSGGPDSTALLHALIDFSNDRRIKIVVAHINHGIRGPASNHDEQFVKMLAKKYNLQFKLKRVKLDGAHLEEQGRNIRREFFETLQKKYKASHILTAHTEDDQLETIVFNFIRGSGVAGLGGMKMLNKLYLKPLLDIPKKEIIRYLKRKKIPYCVDSTNSDTVYRRNFIRKKILPLLEKINPSFRKTVVRNSTVFRQLDEMLVDDAEKFLKKKREKKYTNPVKLFPLENYEQLSEALRAEVIQSAFRSIKKTSYRLPVSKISQIKTMLQQKIGNKKILCPGNIAFILKHKNVYVVSA